MFDRFKKKKQAEPDFDAPLSPEADKFLADACAEYDPKSDALLQGEWRLSSSAGWGFDDSTGIVQVEFADCSRWQAAGQILGSYSSDDQTWEWAWNSPHVDESLSRDSRAVRELGDRLGIAYLQLPGFPVPDTKFVDYLCGIAIKATDSAGVMEAESGPVVVFIMLKDLRWTHGAA